MQHFAGAQRESVNSFASRSVEPPRAPDEQCPSGQVTIGEINGILYTASSMQDNQIQEYLALEARKTGANFANPNIVVPSVGRSDSEEHYGAEVLTRKQKQGPTFATSLWQTMAAVASIPSRMSSMFYNVTGASLPYDGLKPPEKKISAFAWHKYTNKFAIAVNDEQVRIYNLKTNSWSPIILNHEFQRGIRWIEWKPCSGNVLAVACRFGICIWSIVSKPTMINERKVFQDQSAWVNYLTYPKHSPVDSLSWSPSGGALVSGSSASGKPIIWDFSTEQSTSLQVACSGVSVARYSPHGDMLFVAEKRTTVLRVFDTITWQYDTIHNMNAPCRSATWSADGTWLAVALVGQPFIFFFCLAIAGRKKKANLISVETIEPYETHTGTNVTVGDIRDIVWDYRNARLAVSFNNSELIAIYITDTRGTLSLLPLGFIRGPPRAKRVLFMEFRPSFSHGSMLAVCWDTGKLSFYPFYM
mmetsp:Transcript_19645/g.21857  ORF Transcript_19645/g.21857 Transcript_19645/m.21857 type:complete len:473 (+) Transcript_19645:59-1477(+)